ncbi:MAG: hypothetical protein JST75_11210 [Bacteroidetes bacterium]|nr:hypothetical protein [Bacteroidota bacterium]
MIIEILLVPVGLYLFCGFVFAIAFIVKGVSVIDEGAHGGSIGFRIIIIPGTMVFWPLLLKKWLRAKKQQHD